MNAFARIVVIGILQAAVVAAYGEDTGASTKLDRPLRVLTANIWNYAEPYEIRMKLLRDQIEELKPDVIGFQEAGWNPGDEHQVAQLLKGMNYHLDHEADGSNANKRRVLDVAVASRWPMKRKGLRQLPGSGKALAVEITAPSPVDRFCFVSTFSTARWQFDRELNRERDAVALDKFIREISDTAGFPPIIAGDFDATPGNAAQRLGLPSSKKTLGKKRIQYSQEPDLHLSFVINRSRLPHSKSLSPDPEIQPPCTSSSTSPSWKTACFSRSLLRPKVLTWR
ncbi:MAG: endonuclease/exonuclease/phosphatase family protein [Planctomycetota bacterium]|nr:endonuclease/exonuclease/phosphatase family protein [Planctomycetota bacterium]